MILRMLRVCFTFIGQFSLTNLVNSDSLPLLDYSYYQIIILLIHPVGLYDFMSLTNRAGFQLVDGQRKFLSVYNEIESYPYCENIR